MGKYRENLGKIIKFPYNRDWEYLYIFSRFVEHALRLQAQSERKMYRYS